MGNADSYSKEAVRTLLTEVENNRTNTVVILAGYKEQTARLMRSDQGMPRRFPRENHVLLDDYTTDELAQIAEARALSHFDLKFDDGLGMVVSRLISERYSPRIPQENAALAVNLVEQAVDKMAERLMGGDYDEATASVLTAADFGVEISEQIDAFAAKRLAVEDELKVLTGMDELKNMLSTIKKQALYVERGGNPMVMRRSFNCLLLGNPGCGKTTAARLIAKYLHAYGVLPSDTIVERNALALKGQYVGQSCPRVQEAVQDAMGGVLFIDEAYALANGDGYGTEVVRTLLTEIENHRTQFVCILAGYAGPMKNLLAMDPGLARRFPSTLELPNYSALQLASISRTVANQSGFQIEIDALSRLPAYIEQTHLAKIDSHNAGLAVELVEAAIGRLLVRVVDEGLEVTDSASLTLTCEDFELTTSLPCAEMHVLGEEKAIQLPVVSNLQESSPVINVAAKPLPGRIDYGNSNEVVILDADPSADMRCFFYDELHDSPYRSETSSTPPLSEGSADTNVWTKQQEEEEEEELTDDELYLEVDRTKESNDVNTQEETEDDKEKRRQRNLAKCGLCPAGYGWCRRKGCFREPCMKCGKQPLFNDGYQCSAGSHWLCMNCTDKMG